jgi:hypothetical protein
MFTVQTFNYCSQRILGHTPENSETCHHIRFCRLLWRLPLVLNLLIFGFFLDPKDIPSLFWLPQDLYWQLFRVGIRSLFWHNVGAASGLEQSPCLMEIFRCILDLALSHPPVRENGANLYQTAWACSSPPSMQSLTKSRSYISKHFVAPPLPGASLRQYW